jgi:hypothetical protein
MRLPYLLIFLGLGTLGVWIALWVDTPEAPVARRTTGEVASEVEMARPSADVSLPSAPTATRREQRPAEATRPPPTDDPEALAAWFEDQVMRHLEGNGTTTRAEDVHPATLGDLRNRPPIRVATAWPAPPASVERAGPDPSERRDRDVNWAYLQDVFEGRVSGIPNEAKAGISLQEIDELGKIPYIEQLREEERYQELRDLGFENETLPWPACLRTATCRRDHASSPP